MRYCLALLLFLLGYAASAQQERYEIGPPLDIKTAGVNKVLCLKNGNTMLLHFETGKAVVVKVYDSLHKEIATQKHLCRYMDITRLHDAVFKGLYEIDNQAVLFIEQERMSKYILVRLQFNATDGTLVDEKIAGESSSQSKRTRYYVMKNKADDGYAIFFSTDIPQFKNCQLHVVYYNNKHEIARDVQLELNRKDYDLLEVVGAEAQPIGNCITLSLMKKQTEGGTHSETEFSSADVYGHDLFFFYIPAGAAEVRKHLVDVTKDVYPFYAHFTYNSFARSLNLLLFSYREFLYRFGTDIQPSAQKASLFFNLDEATLSVKYKWLRNERANIYYQQQTDSTRLFEGIPLKMFTNENGLSTIFYRSFVRRRSVESHARANVFDSYFGNLCITQFDDDGNELWGTVLPGAQFSRSYDHYYDAAGLGKGWQSRHMFSDLPEQVCNRQFLAQNVYCRDKNFFIVYNDYDKNFNSSVAHVGDTVYSFHNTNACYYRMTRKKELTRHYLFGTPVANEYKSSFIEGADFDEQRGVYATLLQYNKNNDITLRMAWSHLD